MSEGRLAQLTKTTSAGRPRSNIQVVIDIIGVIPDPAEMNRYFSDGWWWLEKRPAGLVALIRIPGFRWSSIQRVPRLPGCALTVTEIDIGREGEDEMVKVR